MKNGLLITSVLVLLSFCASTSIAQQKSVQVPGSSASVDAAKCTGSSNCKACKNCSACAHCKEEGGKCGVCKKNSGSTESATVTTPNDDYTQVAWSAKSLKPAAITLQSLDVRSGPGTSFKLVGNISAEDPLIIIGEREGWYKIVVSHEDLVGFVEVAYVTIVK